MRLAKQHELSLLPLSERKVALLAIADALESHVSEIIAANTEDMERGRTAGLFPTTRSPHA